MRERERERERERGRGDHRLYKLTVCMSVGLSNYRLAWCVEPRVYHNTAPLMTPYTTHIHVKAHTRARTHTDAHNYCTKHLNSCSVSPFLKTTHIFMHTFQATQWYMMTLNCCTRELISAHTNAHGNPNTRKRACAHTHTHTHASPGNLL